MNEVRRYQTGQSNIKGGWNIHEAAKMASSSRVSADR